MRYQQALSVGGRGTCRLRSSPAGSTPSPRRASRRAACCQRARTVSSAQPCPEEAALTRTGQSGRFATTPRMMSRACPKGTCWATRLKSRSASRSAASARAPVERQSVQTRPAGEAAIEGTGEARVEASQHLQLGPVCEVGVKGAADLRREEDCPGTRTHARQRQPAQARAATLRTECAESGPSGKGCVESATNLRATPPAVSPMVIVALARGLSTCQCRAQRCSSTARERRVACRSAESNQDPLAAGRTRPTAQGSAFLRGKSCSATHDVTESSLREATHTHPNSPSDCRRVHADSVGEIVPDRCVLQRRA
jgi:hypothetical protein